MKFSITTVDLTDKVFSTQVVEDFTALEAFVNTLELDLEEKGDALTYYQSRLKVNPEGGWIMDLEDGLILITEL